MFQVASLVMPLFGIIFLGYLSGRIAKIPAEGLAWLNFFVVYVALPPLFFRLLSRTPVEQFTQFPFLASTTFVTLLVFCLTFFIAGWLNRGKVREATVQGFAGAYGNIGYMGPPLAIAAFGPEAGVPVALIFCLDNAMHFTFAPLLMSFGGKSAKPPLQLIGEILKKIFTHPFIIATIVGIWGAIYEIRPWGPVDQLLEFLSNAAAPCALFAMGVTAAVRPLKKIPMELAYLVPIKLVIHPLLMWLLVSQIDGVEPIWLYSAVLLAALPSATNVFVIAQQYGVWQERASSAVVVSTLFATVTVTIYLYLVQQGFVG